MMNLSRRKVIYFGLLSLIITNSVFAVREGEAEAGLAIIKEKVLEFVDYRTTLNTNKRVQAIARDLKELVSQSFECLTLNEGILSYFYSIGNDEDFRLKQMRDLSLIRRLSDFLRAQDRARYSDLLGFQIESLILAYPDDDFDADRTRGSSQQQQVRPTKKKPKRCVIL